MYQRSLLRKHLGPAPTVELRLYQALCQFVWLCFEFCGDVRPRSLGDIGDSDIAEEEGEGLSLLGFGAFFPRSLCCEF